MQQISIKRYRVERTTSTGDMDKFQEVIFAFANDLSGSHIKGYLIQRAYDNGGNVGGKVGGKMAVIMSPVCPKLCHKSCPQTKKRMQVLMQKMQSPVQRLQPWMKRLQVRNQRLQPPKKKLQARRRKSRPKKWPSTFWNTVPRGDRWTK